MTLVEYPLFSGVVVIHSLHVSSFREVHHQEFIFPVREGYSKRLHTIPEADCTGKNELLMMSFAKARNM